MSDLTRSAFLISDDEFASEHALLARYLVSIGVPVVHCVGMPPAFVSENLRSHLAALPYRSIGLVSYHGHGSMLGWHTDSTTNYLSYADISLLISEHEKGYLCVCASTCYSHQLIGRLIVDGYDRHACSVYVDEFCGNTVVNNSCVITRLVDAWSKRRFVTEQSHTMTRRARKLPMLAYGSAVQSYGHHFDHYFWPKNEQTEKTKSAG